MSRTLSLLAVIAMLCVCVYRLAPVEADAATDAAPKMPRDRGADIEAHLGQVTGATKPDVTPSRDQTRPTRSTSFDKRTPLDKLKAATAAGTVPRPEPVDRPSARESLAASPIFIPTSGGEPRSDGAALPRLPAIPDPKLEITPADEPLDSVVSSTVAPRPKPVAVPRAAPASSDGRISPRRQAFRAEEYWSEGRQGGM